MDPFDVALEDFIQDKEVLEECDYKKKLYPEEVSTYVRLVYISGLVLWIAIVVYFRLYQTDVTGWIILFIPPFIFLTGYANCDQLSREVEEHNFQANYFTIGLLLIVPLLTWVNKDYHGDKEKFVSILVLAIIIVLVSLLDVWVKRDYLSVSKHLKSALQTIAIALFIYALYSYYIDNPHSVFI
jgi:hypothetical protein